MKQLTLKEHNFSEKSMRQLSGKLATRNCCLVQQQLGQQCNTYNTLHTSAAILTASSLLFDSSPKLTGACSLYVLYYNLMFNRLVYMPSVGIVSLCNYL